MIEHTDYIKAKQIVSQYEREQLNKSIVKSTLSVRELERNFDFIKVGVKVWMQGQVMFPVEVEVLETEVNKDKRARIKTEYQNGYVNYEKLFKTERECPCR